MRQKELLLFLLLLLGLFYGASSRWQKELLLFLLLFLVALLWRLLNAAK
jgi:hypothetical protein